MKRNRSIELDVTKVQPFMGIVPEIEITDTRSEPADLRNFLGFDYAVYIYFLWWQFRVIYAGAAI